MAQETNQPIQDTNSSSSPMKSPPTQQSSEPVDNSDQASAIYEEIQDDIVRNIFNLESELN